MREREEKTNKKLALPPSHTLLSKSTPTMRCATIVVYFYTRSCAPILTLGESWLQGQLCWALSKVVCSPKISITLRISRINKTVSSENKHIPPLPTTSSPTNLSPYPRKKKIPKTVLLFFFLIAIVYSSSLPPMWCPPLHHPRASPDVPHMDSFSYTPFIPIIKYPPTLFFTDPNTILSPII